MAAITHVGNKLLITRGKYRGCIGEIKEIKQLPCGLIDYDMIIDDSDEDSENKLIITVQSEDCREYCPGSINLEAPFDITNYLSVQEMKSIAKRIFECKIETFVDEILQNRIDYGHGSITQQILYEVVKDYANRLGDKYQEDFLVIFKKVINMELPAVNDEDQKSFARSIQWSLETVANNYIKEHPEEISELVKHGVFECARSYTEKDFTYTLSKNIEKVVKDSLETFMKSESEEKND